MRYTPVELRHVRLGRTMFGGYRRREAHQLLEDVADSFEDVWRDRGELTDKLEEVERRYDELKQRETLLASTLVAAERAAGDAKEAARREAELIVAEAHQEARSVTRTAQGERERLFAEARRVETLLRAVLGMVEEAKHELPLDSVTEPGAGDADAAAAPDPVDGHWPRREDTREFGAVVPDEPEQSGAHLVPSLPPEGPVADEAEHHGPWAGRDFAWG
jgi:cell division initiation protein